MTPQAGARKRRDTGRWRRESRTSQPDAKDLGWHRLKVSKAKDKDWKAGTLGAKGINWS
jgi:hypothetical protein